MKPEILLPEWPAPANVKAFFTLRSPGASRGVWGAQDGSGGFNLGLHAGDRAQDVLANRAALRDSLPGEPLWLRQVHSDRVLFWRATRHELQADGVISTEPGQVCAVMTADCLPVLFCDSKGRAVAAVHAGWRGLAQGILQKAARRMRLVLGDRAAELLAWVGPGIGQESFTVQDDVAQVFRSLEPACAQAGAIQKSAAGWQVDLPAFASCLLRPLGVRVYLSGLSTAQDAQRFYSYRRDKVCGRHAALIWLAS